MNTLLTPNIQETPKNSEVSPAKPLQRKCNVLLRLISNPTRYRLLKAAIKPCAMPKLKLYRHRSTLHRAAALLERVGLLEVDRSARPTIITTTQKGREILHEQTRAQQTEEQS